MGRSRHGVGGGTAMVAGPDPRGARHILIAAGFAFFLGLGLNQILLLMIDRSRPSLEGMTTLLVPPGADPSFPSDHTTAVFATAVTFVLGGMRKRALWFLTGAVLVALSRVFVGIHYAGDVLGAPLPGPLPLRWSRTPIAGKHVLIAS